MKSLNSPLSGPYRNPPPRVPWLLLALMMLLSLLDHCLLSEKLSRAEEALAKEGQERCEQCSNEESNQGEMFTSK